MGWFWLAKGGWFEPKCHLLCGSGQLLDQEVGLNQNFHLPRGSGQQFVMDLVAFSWRINGGA
ncbi:hypothetical protein ZOSMA_50G00340 [Zostera marina]|uniref:Uncharacterized protein n=1 Tax=Zostera marina TaxID=29655 RepID=A0A0K9P0A4_ZOSMR|nr:hypothetical protein ZOSMA_50G00340 [Zostera marina]